MAIWGKSYRWNLRSTQKSDAGPWAKVWLDMVSQQAGNRPRSGAIKSCPSQVHDLIARPRCTRLGVRKGEEEKNIKKKGNQRKAHGENTGEKVNRLRIFDPAEVLGVWGRGREKDRP